MRDVLFGAGMITLGLCTIGLIWATGFHWLAFLDGQAVGIGLLIAATMQDAA